MASSSSTGSTQTDEYSALRRAMGSTTLSTTTSSTTAQTDGTVLMWFAGRDDTDKIIGMGRSGSISICQKKMLIEGLGEIRFTSGRHLGSTFKM
eukprot:14305068-Heterocapsa_arctica.AAC.1